MPSGDIAVDVTDRLAGAGEVGILEQRHQSWLLYVRVGGCGGARRYCSGHGARECEPGQHPVYPRYSHRLIASLLYQDLTQRLGTTWQWPLRRAAEASVSPLPLTFSRCAPSYASQRPKGHASAPTVRAPFRNSGWLPGLVGGWPVADYSLAVVDAQRIGQATYLRYVAWCLGVTGGWLPSTRSTWPGDLQDGYSSTRPSRVEAAVASCRCFVRLTPWENPGNATGSELAAYPASSGVPVGEPGGLGAECAGQPRPGEPAGTHMPEQVTQHGDHRGQRHTLGTQLHSHRAAPADRSTGQYRTPAGGSYRPRSRRRRPLSGRGPPQPLPVTGQTWRYRPADPQQLYDHMVAKGADPEYMAFVRTVFRRTRDGTLTEPECFGAIPTLLGRPASTMRDFLTRSAVAFRY